MRSREHNKPRAHPWAVRLAVWSVLLGILAVILTVSVKMLPAAMGHPPSWTISPAVGTLGQSIRRLAVLAAISGLTALAAIRLRLHALWAVGAVLLATGVWFSVPPRGKARPHIDPCDRRVRGIWFACHTYAMDYDGQFPDRLSSLYPDYVTSLDGFICPYSWDRISSPETIDQQRSYAYVEGLTEFDSPQTVLSFCLGYHSFHDKGVTQVCVDGHTEWRRYGDQYDE